MQFKNENFSKECSAQMLVLSRKHTDTVIFYNSQTMELMAVVAVVSEESNRFRLGFHVPPSIGIIRTELTTFRDLPYGQIIRLPFGTKVEVVGKRDQQEEPAILPE